MPIGPKGQKRPADVIGNAVKVTPAMAAGVSDKLWLMDNLCAMMDAVAPKPGPRGPYKKRTS